MAATLSGRAQPVDHQRRQSHALDVVSDDQQRSGTLVQ
jgi:hypothetical protein